MSLLASHIALVTRIPPRNYTSSTPAAGISPLAPLVFIVFPNTLSAPPVPPRDPSIHYFIVNTTSSTARVNPTTTSSALHPVTPSNQSPSITSPNTMTSTTMATSVASSSASPSSPSSSTSETSAGSSSMFSSTHAVTSVVLSTTNATISTPTSSAQSTSSPSPMTSSSPTTERSSTTSSPSTSTPPLTSNTSFSVASDSRSSSSLSSQTSTTSADIPVTTVLASTTIFITSTNSAGMIITGAPPVVTEVITTTGSGGIATTVTQAVVNPTLAQDNNATGGSSFFHNTGAVVGVFVVVGLASASIMLWILFAIRRRQRMRRIQDETLEAAVTAAGLNRTPLDDDNEDGSPVSSRTRRRLSSGMGQRGSLLGYGSGGSDSLLTSARASEPFEDLLRNTSHADYHRSDPSEGYAPSRTTSPAHRIQRPMPSGSNDYGSSGERKSSYGHTPTYSAGSFEPLLANYGQNTLEQDSSIPPTLPRDSQHLIDAPPPRSASSFPHDPHGNSSDESAEDRSETGVEGRNSSDSSGSIPLRDNGEHSRRVLVVRNVSDSPSDRSV